MLTMHFATAHHQFQWHPCMFVQAAWRNPKYSMQILATATQALQHSWASADALFARLPSWEAQPINARRPFCFYYGHMASFAKLKMLPAVRPPHWHPSCSCHATLQLFA